MPIINLIRDTPFGHTVRFITRGKWLQYLEERDPHAWKKYVHEEKSGYAAHHGTTDPHNDESDMEDRPIQGLGGIRTREGGETEYLQGRQPSDPDSTTTSQTRVPEDGVNYNHASGVKVDPEKGRDIHLIGFIPNDPEVCKKKHKALNSRIIKYIIESSKLVISKEILCYFRNMFADNWHLHWLCDIHGRH
jgi:DHA1 family multidrug resistance protein-like MFS transporter